MNERPSLLARMIGLQVDRPWWVLLFGLLLTVPAFLLARRLELHTGFESLLPEDKASVVELHRVGERTAGVSTLVIVSDVKPQPQPNAQPKGQTNESQKLALRAFGDALLPKLRALGPDWIGTAENGVAAELEFLHTRRALFVSLDELQAIHDRIEDRFDFEVNGSLFGEEPPPVDRAWLEEMLGVSKAGPGAAPGTPPYPDGYYMNLEGTRLVTLVRSPVASGDLGRTDELIAKVRKVIDELGPTRFEPSMHIAFTGDLVTSAEQYGTVKNDLATVGAAGVAMILLVDLLFFLRFRAVAAMAIAIGIGVLWCFALTRLLIGHLNTASGFLVSIVFGNGINFGILLRARYNEARRSGLSLRDAVTAAYRGTFAPTLTVAAAASVGFVSLASTSFRGFRDFGVIGGYGMLLCWLSTFLFMVPLLVIFERASPTFTPEQEKPTLRGKLRAIVDRGLPFGAPFAALVRRVPTMVLVTASLATGGVAMVASVRWLRSDPLEYELWKLENDPGAPSAASKLGEETSGLVGRTGQDGMAMMVERVDQVAPLVAALDARFRAAPEGEKPFSKVTSIFDLVPDHQEEKLTLLVETRARLVRIHQLGKMSDEDFRAIEAWLPPVGLVPFGIDDLPERVARPFTEKDGTRGRIVYIAPTENRSVRDVRYLRLWADAYREVTLPSGEVVHGSGRAVIFADMIESVIAESPKAIGLSFLGTALVVAISLSRGKNGLFATFLVLGALVLGIAWMGGALAFAHIKINFLNFIAVPITFGIGVDYAINVVSRWRTEPPGSVPRIVRETGGAVVLCSLTTTLGYLTLLRSINAAVRSFGLAAVIGEVACVLAALVALPAVLMVCEARGRRRSSAEEVATGNQLGA